MRYNKGMTIKAIASQLNRPVQGMYKAMARLQDTLQRCIEKELAKGDI
jgi:RNA polymerase sigma-70 factor (ECF subfamily)